MNWEYPFFALSRASNTNDIFSPPASKDIKKLVCKKGMCKNSIYKIRSHREKKEAYLRYCIAHEFSTNLHFLHLCLY